MRNKWYVELLLIIAMIVIAIVGVLNIDFSGNQGPDKVFNVKKQDTTSLPTYEKERWLQGRNLFRSHCAACHNINFDGTGPALKGVTGRWKAAGSFNGKTGEQWLHVWIKNWHDVVDAKYQYGVDMHNSRAAEMNVFPTMSDKDIDDILFYIESPDMGAQK